MIVPRRAAFGGVGLALSAALVGLVPVLYGTAQPMVHVIWRGASDNERAALEQRFHLSEATELPGGTWAYVPLDTTRERLRELVLHPQVGTTDGIDRHLFRIAQRGPRTARRGGVLAPSRFAPRFLRIIASALAVAGAGLLLLEAVASRGWSLRDALRGSRISAALVRGIPVASPEAAGIFRIAFGSLVLLYLARNPVYPELLDAYELGRTAGPYGSLMHWMTEHPRVVGWLDPSLKTFGSLFIFGAGTAAAYPAFVAAFLLWASVYTLNTSHHVVAAIGIALVCLLPARWGDAWSVDAWFRERIGGRRRTSPSKHYGFAMWVPVLVLGVTLFAAAGSKLREGSDWILNGTVKYHFISDLEHAWVSWGPRLTQHHAVAVTMSAAVVVLEALVLTAAFSRSDGYRLAIGGSVAGLLAGFAVFQGIVWPGWWILLVGFLPWHRIRGGSDAGAAGSLSLTQRTILATFVLFQIYASSARIEARPIVSAYDMYATTYASDEEYELASNLRYRILAVTPGRAPDDLACDIDDEAARVLMAAGSGGSTERLRMRPLMTACLRGRRDVAYVMLEGDRQVFDRGTGQFAWKRRVDQIGPVPVAWLWN